MFHYFCPFVLFLQDLELLKVDICQPKEETKTPLKPVKVKQEIQVNPVKKLLMIQIQA